MKAMLMALAVLFALVGFINSYYGDYLAGTNDRALQAINDAKASPYVNDISLNSLVDVHSLLFFVQIAIGCVMVGYFIRNHRNSKKDLDWDY